MHIKKLTDAFYRDNTHLIEALDLENGNWIRGKTRGYGIAIIAIKNLMFGIPLRSNIRHDGAYITKRAQRQFDTNKGLDFSKALLLTQTGYISSDNFSIPPDEHNKLRGKEHFIVSKFEKYVERYIRASMIGDRNVINSPEYRYTTLQNYHRELGIDARGKT